MQATPSRLVKKCKGALECPDKHVGMAKTV